MEYQTVGSAKDRKASSSSSRNPTTDTNIPSTPTPSTTSSQSHYPPRSSSRIPQPHNGTKERQTTRERTGYSPFPRVDTNTNRPPLSKPSTVVKEDESNANGKVRIFRPPNRVRRRTEDPPTKPLPNTPVPIPKGLTIRKSRSSSLLPPIDRRGTSSTLNTVTPTEIISHYNSQPNTPNRRSFDSASRSEISALIVPPLPVPSGESTEVEEHKEEKCSFDSLELLSGAYDYESRARFLSESSTESELSPKSKSKKVKQLKWEPREAGALGPKKSVETLDLARFIRDLPSKEVDRGEGKNRKIAKTISLHSAFVPISASAEILSSTDQDWESSDSQETMTFQGHDRGNRNTSLSKVINNGSSVTRVLKPVFTYYVCMWCKAEAEALRGTTEKKVALNNHSITPDFYRFIVFDPCGVCLDRNKNYLESIQRRTALELQASEDIVKKNVAKRKGIFADEKPKVSIEIVYYPPSPSNVLIKDKENKVTLYSS